MAEPQDRRELILTRAAYTDGGRQKQRSPFLSALGDALIPAENDPASAQLF